MNIPNRSRYRKRVGAFGAIDVKHDESVVDFSVAALCYNFDTSTGALRGGYGIAPHPAVPKDAVRYWVYRGYSEEAGGYIEQYIYQLRNGLLRYYDPVEDKIKYMSGVARDVVDAVNYRLNSEDILILSCNDREVTTWNGKALTQHANAPKVNSMALHYERLFVIDRTQPTRMYFSDDLDPTNWDIGVDGAGFIELLDERGNLNKVVSFGGYLYIFREHGISRITAYGDQREFSASNLFTTAGRIYPESIAKCGGVMMFLASDGLYVFDGYNCSKRLDNITAKISGAPGASAFFEGKYYLSCRMDFGDGRAVGCEAGEHKLNALIVFDVTTGEYSISRGLDIEAMSVCTYNGEDFLMACDSNTGAGVIKRCGKRLSENLEKHWESPASDFGAPDKTKIVRELYIDSSVDAILSVTAKSKKTLAVKNGKKRIRCNVAGDTVKLAIDTTSPDCVIRAPTLIYSSF